MTTEWKDLTGPQKSNMHGGMYHETQQVPGVCAMTGYPIPAVYCGRAAWDYLRSDRHIGKVVSTFSGGVNVLFEADVLITLQSVEVPLQPWAVKANLPWERVCEEDVVLATVGEICVGTLSLRLHTVEVIELQLSPVEETASFLTLVSRLRILKGVKRSKSNVGYTPSRVWFDAKYRKILDEWVSDGPSFPLRRLIGMGMGLTPTGDDILVGIIGGLEVLGYILGVDKFGRKGICETLDRLRIVIGQEAPRRTNLASSQALLSAIEGRFCEVLIQLLDGLFQPSATARQIASSGQSVLSLGHTSGMGFLTGVIAALERGVTICS